MADINGAGTGTLGGLGSSADGQVEWWHVALNSPPDGEIQPATAPTLKWIADTWDNSDVDVQVQVSTSPGFGSTVLDTTVLDCPGDGVTLSSVAAPGLVDGTTYYWRARVVDAGPSLYDGEWTTVWSFQVLIGRSDAVDYIYENVGVTVTLDPDGVDYVYENVGFEMILEDRGSEYVNENVGFESILQDAAYEYSHYGDVNTLTPHPRIWFLLPNFGREGDGIAIYGFGFGDLQSTFSGVVEIDWGGVTGWQSVPIVSWQTFPPTADAYTANRVLSELTGVSDPQHQVIEIVVPSGAIPPGYPVRVRTEGP